ncbi:polyamine aminopropyltransferase [Guptibacillus algicola]|uniref:polyamine aminopropyltransferase n=1 Tax=Guptibacillus algicola TaxID=225844 RepID=UPI001CD46AF0|nr:polyamine aminopropyltransferase [Alkalihalobacillus algicola]MCA0986342.1 polyamine aminopropyltransferase [Alkalihalobacillus algicola]
MSNVTNKSSQLYWASGIVSICGIIFEVLFGALGSYILGDGVKQYTITISLFLTGMGIGASLSERVVKNLITRFIVIELMIGIIGGVSSFAVFGITSIAGEESTAIFLYSIILIVGGLTGLELPILIRKANEIGVEMNKSTARVLFSDYAGGLVGGLLFAFYLRPEFGLVKSAFLVALINILVAFWMIISFRKEIVKTSIYIGAASFALLLMIAGVLFGEEIAFSFEQRLYKDPIIFSEETSYQRIVLTKEQGDLRLYLNGQLQFSSSDEHRYHETLVHVPMAASRDRNNILLLGGGDGLAVRELLKYEEVDSITVVDLDPRMVDIARTNHMLVELNQQAFEDKRVKVVNADAFKFMKNEPDRFDVIISDLPDPNNESLNKLYTWEFYSMLRNHLKQNGAMMVQATSPVFATEAYWTISKTIRETGLYTTNLHVDIPSFGNWGFVLGTRSQIDSEDLNIQVKTDYLTSEMVPSLTAFGKDEDSTITKNGEKVTLEPNTLIRPNLIDKYENAWQQY